ncbi:MAG: BtrH N-terminal domain-containing protein [Bdellovibrionales bacterium]
MNPPTEFQHHHSAHCESGVTSNLLKNSGMDVSEAMAFGIGSGLFFVHLPFVKVMGIPLTSYRSFPGGIFKKTCKRLGVPFNYQSFRNPIRGNRALEEMARAGRAVGVRANIFWLNYIPEKFRFQFNAHNLVVYGREASGEYRVSDPVLEGTSLCPSQSMTRARFSKGPLSPKGLLFYPTASGALDEARLQLAVRKGVRETVNGMLYAPLWFAGVKGIRYLSRRMRRWNLKIKDQDKLKLYVSNIVRMQEEIGTGGAGFRLLYAAFLQEAGERFNDPALLQAARELTEAGVLWREFATLAARFCKDRLEGGFDAIPDLLLKIADREEAVYRGLRRNYL